MAETHFLKTAFEGAMVAWSGADLSSVSMLHVPDSILGSGKAVLRADVHLQWSYWFVESLLDPNWVVREQPSFSQLYGCIRGRVCELFPRMSGNERNELSREVTSAAKILANAYRDSKRGVLDGRTRQLLLDLSGEKPRCWICGARFRQESIEAFICAMPLVCPLPPFVDFLKPRGLKLRDLAIEIDHVLPFSRGGGESDNLRLACGWCNSKKSNHLTVYDVGARARPSGSNRLGIESLPQPLWVVRALVAKAACDHPGGCDRTPRDSEFTVAPLVAKGSPNPVNLGVFCVEHDPLESVRLKSRQIVESLWLV